MEKLDLTQVLKDCPVGTKLYSPIFGEVEFNAINESDPYPIEVLSSNEDWATFSADGKYCNKKEAECLLFPSCNNRDWSTFKSEQPQHDFAPFEHVIVWDQIDGCWANDFYAYFDTKKGCHQCVMHSASVCIPYEGNEALLGTTNEPK